MHVDHQKFRVDIHSLRKRTPGLLFLVAVVAPWCQISFYSLFIVLLNCEQKQQELTRFYRTL